MVRGILLSDKRFIEDYANSGRESHLWYRYIPEKVLRVHTEEVGCLVTEEFDPGFWDYIPFDSKFTVKFWLEGIPRLTYTIIAKSTYSAPAGKD